MKKWVRFVAVQQNSLTLTYDLNIMKGTVKSYLKKSHPVLQVSKVQFSRSHSAGRIERQSALAYCEESDKEKFQLAKI